MRSALPDGDTAVDDRTTKARIRDAAIECFAELGVAGTTARKVAATADVSPGLVMHHFGSMDGLREACDAYAAAVIRQTKQEAIAAGPELDVLAAFRSSKSGWLMRYLARMLVEDSSAAADLVDDLVRDAAAYLRQGVDAGVVRASDDPNGRATVLVVWSLGALVLHDHLRRILGVDVTDPDVTSDPAFAAYAGPAYEILGEGIFTEAFAANLRATFAGGADPPAGDLTERPAATSKGTS